MEPKNKKEISKYIHTFWLSWFSELSKTFTFTSKIVQKSYVFLSRFIFSSGRFDIFCLIQYVTFSLFSSLFFTQTMSFVLKLKIINISSLLIITIKFNQNKNKKNNNLETLYKVKTLQ